MDDMAANLALSDDERLLGRIKGLEALCLYLIARDLGATKWRRPELHRALVDIATTRGSLREKLAAEIAVDELMSGMAYPAERPAGAMTRRTPPKGETPDG